MSLKGKIDKANKEALSKILEAQPHWVDVQKAIDVCPGLEDRMIMHAGPPISWDKMGSSQKNAVKGAAIYEGWAKDKQEADDLVSLGKIVLAPCHEHGTVGSMCGVTSPSMPVFVVENMAEGNKGHVLLYENPEREKLSFGFFDENVLKNLKWIDNVLAPVLKSLIDKMGPLSINPIIARALTMGDEVHSRNFASTSLFNLTITPYLFDLGYDSKTMYEVTDFIKRSDQFFLHLVMAASKATADAAYGVPYSTLVTAIARNGVEVGIRVSGLPGVWFTGSSGPVEGLFFAGYSQEDAQPDMGDSAVTETIGLGAFAHAASPALALTKGNVEMALRYTKEMEEICIGNNPNFGIPALGGKGTPVGIDIRKVLKTGIAPVINTGIAHKKGGQIGVGNTRSPMSAFKDAIKAFQDKYQ